MSKLRVAIIGSGNIGTDLLIKVLRSPYLECTLFVGRRLGSPGMTKAMSLGVPISDRSIDAIVDQPDCCDLVFDCTSAEDHKVHWPVLEKLNKIAIDLTPAKIGEMCIPAINLGDCLSARNVNMISCGGQTSIPIAYTIGQIHKELDYIEVVSTIASRSAGPGTRINIDDYIVTTETGISAFSHCTHAKAILNLNPAEPPINMQTTIFAKVKKPKMDELKLAITAMVDKIKLYVPGYRLIMEPTYESERIIVMVTVQGMGDYLQKYAGNLDIINCAALATAEAFAQKDGANSGSESGDGRKQAACQE